MDKLTPEKRSALMSRIRSDGNRSTEARFRAYLVKYGYRGWCMQQREMLGKPDFVFYDYKLAIFIDGAFWHGAPGFKRVPKSNCEYWSNKIRKNIERDQYVGNMLRSKGWSVLRFFDYELESNPRDVLKRLDDRIKKRAWKVRNQY